MTEGELRRLFSAFGNVLSVDIQHGASRYGMLS